MELEASSVKNLLGENNEVLVFGLIKCLYFNVKWALKKLNYKAYIFDSIPFNLIQADDISTHRFGSSRGAECKRILTSLIAENYSRQQANLALIKLIFCVEKEDKEGIVKLNLEKIAHTRNMNGCITDEELRRCYKMYTDSSPEIKKLILETIQFVKVKAISQDLYQLEPLSPFWEDPNWKLLWKERLDAKSNPDLYKFYSQKYKLFWHPDIEPYSGTQDIQKQKKVFPWRTVLMEKLSDQDKDANIKSSDIIFKH